MILTLVVTDTWTLMKALVAVTDGQFQHQEALELEGQQLIKTVTMMILMLRFKQV